jgi:hypothetical protein
LSSIVGESEHVSWRMDDGERWPAGGGATAGSATLKMPRSRVGLGA